MARQYTKRNLYRAKHEPRFCLQCSVEFTPFHPRTVFCTPRCLKLRDWSRYYYKNKNKFLAWQKKYRKGREHLYREWARVWVLKNPERNKEHKQAWAKKNNAYLSFKCATRRALRARACPKWLTSNQLDEIKYIYKTARELSWLSDGGLHVDHIVPLNGKIVSGLHVPWNLQIIPAADNIRKSNKLVGVA